MWKLVKSRRTICSTRTAPRARSTEVAVSCGELIMVTFAVRAAARISSLME